MNILLLGIMGAGKSTVGKRLAQVLDYQFLELDTVVLEHTGFSSITEVYEHRASLWKECELEISKDMSLDNHQVIACGGGFTDNALNLLYFKEHNPVCVIYLHASPDTLSYRLLSNMDQERIVHQELADKMNDLYQKRDPFYRLYSDSVIETDGRQAKQVVQEILAKIAAVSTGYQEDSRGAKDGGSES